MSLSKPPVQSAQSRRAASKVASKLVENEKSLLVCSTASTTRDVREFLLNILQLCSPLSNKCPKPLQNPINDSSEILPVLIKQDTALFVHGSSTKKRPNNLVFGRKFDSQLIQQQEFELKNFLALEDVKSKKPMVNCKPAIVFLGDYFENNVEFIRLKSLFLDLFRGQTVKKIVDTGIQWTICISAVNNEIRVRSYVIDDLTNETMKSVQSPVHLTPMGFSFDLVMRRSFFDDKVYEKAMIHPKLDKDGKQVQEKQKNVEIDEFGRKFGTIHVDGADVNKLNLRKFKGLRKGGDDEGEEGYAENEEELMEFEEESDEDEKK
ncbi:Brix domain containing protein [Spironucleus salmonicida]|uniref:Ribosome production factor 2 homolog n=1 Tax=Spironucleus salmonicida TaxID=348837 RepID=V6LVR3_9EUKA|nr:Brix domain containing protein [Spironucleus salmonicida]|eukprot:EST48338.1 Brix domain containing protein [Spironucleus salmonicida]